MSVIVRPVCDQGPPEYANFTSHKEQSRKLHRRRLLQRLTAHPKIFGSCRHSRSAVAWLSSKCKATKRWAPATDTPTNHQSIAIDHDFEGRVLVLHPAVDQWLDFPTIIAFAMALGAGQVGAFKVVLLPGVASSPTAKRRGQAKS